MPVILVLGPLAAGVCSGGAAVLTAAASGGVMAGLGTAGTIAAATTATAASIGATTGAIGAAGVVVGTAVQAGKALA